MSPMGDPLPLTPRGERAGRLAAAEMLETQSPQTGGLQGVLARLEAVGDLVAEQHQRAGMPGSDIRMWRFGFQAGVGIELGEHMRGLRAAIAPAR